MGNWGLIAARADIYSYGMARAASLAARGVRRPGSRPAPRAMLRWRLVPAPRRSETTVQRGASSPASPPSVQGADDGQWRVAARRRCSWDSAPRWASPAQLPPIRMRLAGRGQAAGFLFGYPLMAGSPQPYSDKILWVVASPRDGMPLQLTGHPLPRRQARWYHRPGQRIHRQGRSTLPKSKTLRQAAGSSLCHGTGTRTLLTSGTSGTGSNSETSTSTRQPARAAKYRKPHGRTRIMVPCENPDSAPPAYRRTCELGPEPTSMGTDG